MIERGRPHALGGELRHVCRECGSQVGQANLVSYLFAGFSTEQVKLLASLVSPEPLYQAFRG